LSVGVSITLIFEIFFLKKTEDPLTQSSAHSICSPAILRCSCNRSFDIPSLSFFPVFWTHNLEQSKFISSNIRTNVRNSDVRTDLQ